MPGDHEPEPEYEVFLPSYSFCGVLALARAPQVCKFGSIYQVVVDKLVRRGLLQRTGSRR